MVVFPDHTHLLLDMGLWLVIKYTATYIASCEYTAGGTIMLLNDSWILGCGRLLKILRTVNIKLVVLKYCLIIRWKLGAEVGYCKYC